MGRTADGTFTDFSWTPPNYSVDEAGKIIGLVNESTPNNWGRWGDDDQRGTTNFITRDVVTAAASLIRTGKTVSMAIPLDATGPVHWSRPNVVHFFGYNGADHLVGSELSRIAPGYQGADDFLMMPLQGSTQWDGLAHIFSQDAMYNGYWMGNVESFAGAKRNAISQQKASLSSRGVLLDLPKFLGVERCTPGVAISPEQLDACASAQGVEIRRGDILLLRTGHVPWFYSLADKSEFWEAGAPGLGMESADWLHEKEVAALAIDNIAVEVEPSQDPEAAPYPLHVRLIRDLGLTLGEVWWLEELAQTCEAESRYEFFLSAAPLNITGGSGSPINPIAVF